jgi:hypothetical protein
MVESDPSTTQPCRQGRVSARSRFFHTHLDERLTIPRHAPARGRDHRGGHGPQRHVCRSRLPWSRRPPSRHRRTSEHRGETSFPRSEGDRQPHRADGRCGGTRTMTGLASGPDQSKARLARRQLLCVPPRHGALRHPRGGHGHSAQQHGKPHVHQPERRFADRRRSNGQGSQRPPGCHEGAEWRKATPVERLREAIQKVYSDVARDPTGTYEHRPHKSLVDGTAVLRPSTPPPGTGRGALRREIRLTWTPNRGTAISSAARGANL